MSGDVNGEAADDERDDVAGTNADGSSVASADSSEQVEGGPSLPAPGEFVGAGLLATIPVALLSVPIAGLLVVTGAAPAALGPGALAVLVATVVGLGGSYALGPVLVRRSHRNLPAAKPIEPLEALVTETAAARGLEPPQVRFVDADAATVAVLDSLAETTVILPTRIRELDEDAQAAVVGHALTRIETRNAALATALLAPALLVEAWTLLGMELAHRREEPEEDDRLPQMLGAGDREEREVPWVVFAAAGVLLLVTVAPLWTVFAAGDRLLVGGGRTRTDDAANGPGGLADALAFARDARGDRDWPPTLDRLSLVGMADPATKRVRGTSRTELRIRLGRLRAREHRETPQD